MPERDAREGEVADATEPDPFLEAEVISVYSSAQAVADGIKIQLGPRLWCTTNFARSVASSWFVKKGNHIIAGPFASSAQAMNHVHDLQPQSAEWARRHDDVSIAVDVDSDVLLRIVTAIVAEYSSGSYAVPRRADRYGEADVELASYLVEPRRGVVDEAASPSEQEVKVWAIGDHEGLHLLLPEDYWVAHITHIWGQEPTDNPLQERPHGGAFFGEKGDRMKAQDLKSIVNTVSPALTGATLPICSCIHFSHDRIWATNLEATIEQYCDVAGVVASIPSKPLKALLSSMDPNETIELRAVEGTLSLRTTTGVTVLTGLDAEDVPNTKITEPVVASAKLESEFVDCLHAVAVAASGDRSRQVLTGVLLELAEGKICLTATDSYRLHHDEVPASTQGVVEVISPYRYAKALPGKEPIALEVTEDKIRLTEGGIAVTMTRIEGSFPKYRQLRPVSTTGEAVMGMAPESLQRTLKACERLAHKMGAPCPLVLEFSHGTRRADAVVKLGDAGEHRCELNLESYSGDSLRIGFNPSFLREAFSFAGIRMAMTDEVKPVVITGRKQESYALLMPVRLG